MKKHKHLKIIFIVSLLLVHQAGCMPDTEQDEKHPEYKNGISVKFRSAKKGSLEKSLGKNTYNQIGLFLAGKKSEKYKKIQRKKYYKTYTQAINDSWNQITAKNLEEINKWNNLYFSSGIKDSSTLFYPFSGPDFLYADAFFPNADSYFLVGLENPGKLPNIAKMGNKKRAAYLHKLLHSLRYINEAGYFTTKQMMTDFADSNLNGIIHLLLFYISKTGHTLTEISSVVVDDYGKIKEKKNFQVEDKNPNGIKISFFKESSEEIKTLYYFPFDLSDENLKDNIGFLMFLSSLGQKNTFLKSASYILHDDDFRLVRELILKQSKYILQDDSGIPYSILKNSGYNVELFGNYSRTIKIFAKNFQPDLQKDLLKKASGQLYFKLGYNSWENEMVLLLAKKSNETVNQPVTYKRNKETVIYKVQFKSSWKKIPVNSKILKGMPPVDYYFRDGLYKYTIGNCSNQKECEKLIKIAVNNGFTDAFTVAFYQKNRISLEEAEKLRDL
ncbi:MAG: hypothetical protein B6I20_12775 [Bacteroidetes bacterium 4572_117]|nr:MAG: hypothetical protein B6I20_12775 [Bacteroidetes bacterium 4572_117]